MIPRVGPTSRPAAAGGGGGPLLVLDTPPADQPLAAGTTAADPITFLAPSGGSGSYSYVVSLDVVSASGTPAIAGSGLGPYTVTGLSDGDNVVVRRVTTDTETGQEGDDAVSIVVGAAAGGGSLVALLDLSGVNYNFLTTGGTGGTGGEGPHTVAGLSWTMSFKGTGGPTRCEIVNGVLHYEGSASARGFLVANLGADVSADPFMVYCSLENVSRVSSASFALYVAETDDLNEANQGQMLLGSSSATNLLMRECTSSSPAFTTVSSPNTLTDVTTTATLMGMHVSSGSWIPCYSQGDATLPTDGALFGTIPTTKWAEGAGASARQDRPYIQLNCIENADIRLSVLAQRLAP